jgi:hypothetical protein
MEPPSRAAFFPSAGTGVYGIAAGKVNAAYVSSVVDPAEGCQALCVDLFDAIRAVSRVAHQRRSQAYPRLDAIAV